MRTLSLQGTVSQLSTRVHSRIRWRCVPQSRKAATFVQVSRTAAQAAKDIKKGKPLTIVCQEELYYKDKSWESSTHMVSLFSLLTGSLFLAPGIRSLPFGGEAYIWMIATAAISIGSHRSLSQRPPQSLSLKESILAPFVASFSLFGFFLLLKFFPELDLKGILSWYFGLISFISLFSNLRIPMGLLIQKAAGTENVPIGEVTVPKWLLDDNLESDDSTSAVQIELSDALGATFSLALIIYSALHPELWSLRNFVTLNVISEIISLISLRSFKTASILLIGLALYDVFWVFESSNVVGENVMLSVATSAAFDGPTKLVVPAIDSSKHSFSILGSGDVVVPGIFMGLLRRFDRVLAKGDTRQSLYFNTSLVAYTMGLAGASFANSATKLPQPALLYLVPSLLLATFGLSFIRGDLSEISAYSDPEKPNERR